MNTHFIPLRKLVKEPYSSVLAYPKGTKKELEKRIKELKKIGIQSISFQGELYLGSLRVLGKGHIGVVVLAKKGKKDVALKIRRIDSTRSEMENEAKLLKIANKVNVGPRFIANSKNFVIMEFVGGKKIIDWMKALKGKGSTTKLKATIRKILEDCYNLDQIGLDHGELSTIHKHVLIGKSQAIIDFESGSTKRRVSNLTSATQSIFIGSAISKIVKRIYKIPSKKEMIDCLRIYKKNKTRENFEAVLQVFKLRTKKR